LGSFDFTNDNGMAFGDGAGEMGMDFGAGMNFSIGSDTQCDF